VSVKTPAQLALPIKKFAEAHGVHPSTVWRAVRDGRLEFITVNKRKLILSPPVQRISDGKKKTPEKI
jgi:hypothetical protein